MSDDTKQTVPVIVEDLETVNEDLRKHYRQNEEGKFQLDATSLHNAYTRTKDAKNDLRRKYEEANQKLSAIDPEEIDMLRKRAAELDDLKKREREDRQKREQEEAEKAKDIEKIKKMQEDRLSAQQEQYEKQLQELQKKNRNLMEKTVQGELMSQMDQAFSSQKVVKPHYLKEELRRHIKIAEQQDGSLGLEIQSTKDPSAKLTSVEDLVAEYKANEMWADVFAGSGVSGSGAMGAGQTAPPVKAQFSYDQLDTMSDEEVKELQKKAKAGKIKIG